MASGMKELYWNLVIWSSGHLVILNFQLTNQMTK